MTTSPGLYLFHSANCLDIIVILHDEVILNAESFGNISNSLSVPFVLISHHDSSANWFGTELLVQENITQCV